ncbi:putative Fe-S cluster assembly protein SufT [Kushneria phosphatilytica]|uniref:Putative Fe-S cluster assembly protein SufT n=1 Tax=Kushneria phosphatilytica TaxID=657387 RepID=A0A1S1NY42_9GAMM|nr:putative Fe-S cluster assembly protein SufT [Kushneria phosphatilytica]OHV09954.1 putative Fe-S cluster assembly protein SufT [Kushneria phosphatilytica]QEL11633.1 putative Fe-S cluster assembly protein SufT [Kushneria phosphatilytica]
MALESLYKGQQLPLQRSVEAVAIPSGQPVTLEEDTVVQVTQALGTAVTVVLEYSMYLIEGHDLDALGLEPAPRPTLHENATDEELEAFVWEQLKTCYDPEIPVNIVELGLVYGCRIDTLISGEKMVNVRMTLTAPGCGMGDVIAQDAKRKIESAPQVQKVHIEIVFSPPWSRDMMSDEAKLELNMF